MSQRVSPFRSPSCRAAPSWSADGQLRRPASMAGLPASGGTTIMSSTSPRLTCARPSFASGFTLNVPKLQVPDPVPCSRLPPSDVIHDSVEQLPPWFPAISVFSTLIPPLKYEARAGLPRPVVPEIVPFRSSPRPASPPLNVSAEGVNPPDHGAPRLPLKVTFSSD